MLRRVVISYLISCTLAHESIVRTTRSRIVYLRNDYKALMAVIEKHIHEHFARQTQNTPDASSITEGPLATEESSPSRSLQVLGPPFAKVNSVVVGSPAELAGLKAGDEVRNFGYVNQSNHDGLKRVAECVQGNEGRDVLVKISRASSTGQRRQELQLTLRPRRDWGGRGLLGCHILPL